MKINLNKELKNLKGDVFPEKMNEVVADRLFASHSDDSVKNLDLSLKLFNDGQIEIDESDLEKLIQSIKSFQLADGLRGQILKEINLQRK